MKLTKSKLKQIIKEELRNILSEEDIPCLDASTCAPGQECILDTCQDPVHPERAPWDDSPEVPTTEPTATPKSAKLTRCAKLRFVSPIAYKQCLADA